MIQLEIDAFLERIRSREASEEQPKPERARKRLEEPLKAKSTKTQVNQAPSRPSG